MRNFHVNYKLSQSKFSIVLSLFICVGSALSQNSATPCNPVNGKPRICTHIYNCQEALTNLKQNIRPQICGFEQKNPMVCCDPDDRPTDIPQTSQTTRVSQTTEPLQPTARPQSVSTTPRASQSGKLTPKPRPQSNVNKGNRPGLKSEQKCREYAELVFRDPIQEVLAIDPDDDGSAKPEKVNTCGIKEEALIVGGTQAASREFPHQVNIGYNVQGTIKYLCTGSLISENFVLSAAHCGATQAGSPKWAVVGDLHIESDEDEANPVTIEIAEIFNHPNYNTDKPYNDIALFRLKENVTFDEFKRPACLQTEHTFKETKAIASGWGRIINDGPSSPILLKVRLDVIPQSTCSMYYRPGKLLSVGIDDKRMICAGDLRGGKDTCQGDSGGPLQNPTSDPYCMYKIIGVTAFGRKCGDVSPGVYTRVSHYLPWIEGIVWP